VVIVQSLVVQVIVLVISPVTALKPKLAVAIPLKLV
jgi:hypothetical protein